MAPRIHRNQDQEEEILKVYDMILYTNTRPLLLVDRSSAGGEGGW